MRELRCDRGRLSKAKRTTQGFARVDARLTRTGILTYTRADGSVQHEYRPAEEVFAPKSLETLDGAVVTDLHPTVMVDASNAQQLTRGHVRAPRADGRFIGAELQVESAELLTKIDAGDRAEISCGYTCDLDMTPGEFEGQRYDAVQRNIEYNHVAIGPRNWGRAGNEVALRLDAADANTTALVGRFDEGATGDDNEGARDNPGKKIKMKLGKFEIKVDATDEQIVADALKVATDRAESAEAKVAELQAAAGAAAVQLKAATDRADAAEARVAKIDRAELEQSARVALGAEAKFDGQTDLQVRAAVVAKMLPAVHLDGCDAAFVQGAYAAAVELARTAAAERKSAAEQSALGARTDSNDANDPSKARADMVARARAAAK